VIGASSRRLVNLIQLVRAREREPERLCAGALDVLRK
jgi:hypothetical protein